MTSRTAFTSLLVLFAASTIASVSCGGSDTKIPPPPSVTTSTGVTTGDFVTATTGTGGSGGAGGAGGMGSTSSAGGGSGTGGMAGCMTASECPGTDNDCQTRLCAQGVCDFVYQQSGTQPAMQSAGDCKAVVCDGAGATKTIEDEQDGFDDKNPCTDDVCVGGVTTHPASSPGMACGGGKVCDGKGACL